MSLPRLLKQLEGLNIEDLSGPKLNNSLHLSNLLKLCYEIDIAYQLIVPVGGMYLRSHLTVDEKACIGDDAQRETKQFSKITGKLKVGPELAQYVFDELLPGDLSRPQAKIQRTLESDQKKLKHIAEIAFALGYVVQKFENSAEEQKITAENAPTEGTKLALKRGCSNLRAQLANIAIRANGKSDLLGQLADSGRILEARGVDAQKSIADGVAQAKEIAKEMHKYSSQEETQRAAAVAIKVERREVQAFFQRLAKEEANAKYQRSQYELLLAQLADKLNAEFDRLAAKARKYAIRAARAADGSPEKAQWIKDADDAQALAAGLRTATTQFFQTLPTKETIAETQELTTRFISQCDRLLQDDAQTTFTKHHNQRTKIIVANIAFWLTLVGLVIGVSVGLVKKFALGKDFLIGGDTESSQQVAKTQQTVRNINKKINSKFFVPVVAQVAAPQDHKDAEQREKEKNRPASPRSGVIA